MKEYAVMTAEQAAELRRLFHKQIFVQNETNQDLLTSFTAIVNAQLVSLAATDFPEQQLDYLQDVLLLLEQEYPKDSEALASYPLLLDARWVSERPTYQALVTSITQTKRAKNAELAYASGWADYMVRFFKDFSGHPSIKLCLGFAALASITTVAGLLTVAPAVAALGKDESMLAETNELALANPQPVVESIGLTHVKLPILPGISAVFDFPSYPDAIFATDQVEHYVPALLERLINPATDKNTLIKVLHKTKQRHSTIINSNINVSKYSISLLQFVSLALIDDYPTLVDRVLLLVKYNADLNAPYQTGTNYVLDLCHTGNVGLLKAIENITKTLPNKIQWDFIATDNQYDALTYAVLSQNAEMVEYVIQRQPNVLIRAKEATNPLFVAVVHRAAVDAIKPLLKINGPEQLRIKDTEGRTVLHIAAQQGAEGVALFSMVNELAKANTWDNWDDTIFFIKDRENNTAFDLAVKSGNTAVVQFYVTLDIKNNLKILMKKMLSAPFATVHFDSVTKKTIINKIEVAKYVEALLLEAEKQEPGGFNRFISQRWNVEFFKDLITTKHYQVLLYLANENEHLNSLSKEVIQQAFKACAEEDRKQFIEYLATNIEQCNSAYDIIKNYEIQLIDQLIHTNVEAVIQERMPEFNEDEASHQIFLTAWKEYETQTVDTLKELYVKVGISDKKENLLKVALSALDNNIRMFYFFVKNNPPLLSSPLFAKPIIDKFCLQNPDRVNMLFALIFSPVNLKPVIEKQVDSSPAIQLMANQVWAPLAEQLIATGRYKDIYFDKNTTYHIIWDSVWDAAEKFKDLSARKTRVTTIKNGELVKSGISDYYLYLIILGLAVSPVAGWYGKVFSIELKNYIICQWLISNLAQIFSELDAKIRVQDDSVIIKLSADKIEYAFTFKPAAPLEKIEFNLDAKKVSNTLKRFLVDKELIEDYSALKKGEYVLSRQKMRELSKKQRSDLHQEFVAQLYKLHSDKPVANPLLKNYRELYKSIKTIRKIINTQISNQCRNYGSSNSDARYTAFVEEFDIWKQKFASFNHVDNLKDLSEAVLRQNITSLEWSKAELNIISSGLEAFHPVSDAKLNNDLVAPSEKLSMLSNTLTVERDKLVSNITECYCSLLKAKKLAVPELWAINKHDFLTLKEYAGKGAKIVEVYAAFVDSFLDWEANLNAQLLEISNDKSASQEQINCYISKLETLQVALHTVKNKAVVVDFGQSSGVKPAKKKSLSSSVSSPNSAGFFNGKADKGSIKKTMPKAKHTNADNFNARIVYVNDKLTQHEKDIKEKVGEDVYDLAYGYVANRFIVYETTVGEVQSQAAENTLNVADKVIRNDGDALALTSLEENLAMFQKLSKTSATNTPVGMASQAARINLLINIANILTKNPQMQGILLLDESSLKKIVFTAELLARPFGQANERIKEEAKITVTDSNVLLKEKEVINSVSKIIPSLLNNVEQLTQGSNDAEASASNATSPSM